MTDAAPVRLLPRFVLGWLSVCAALFPLARFTTVVPKVAIQAALGFTLAILVLLFIWMFVDRRVRAGVDAANLEMREGRSMFMAPSVGSLDPRWGLFGARTGGRYHQRIRLLLALEFGVALFTNGATAMRADTLLACCAFGLVVMLSIVGLRQMDSHSRNGEAP
jgi:hypothetical protein